MRARLYVVRLISCPTNSPTLSLPSTFANFNSSEPEPAAGSYTLFTRVLPTTVIFARISETSCGV